jgi:hypothetical protein
LRHLRNIGVGAVLVAAFGSSMLSGQTGETPAADQFKGLHYRAIGPAQASGRVSDVAVYEANPSIF